MAIPAKHNAWYCNRSMQFPKGRGKVQKKEPPKCRGLFLFKKYFLELSSGGAFNRGDVDSGT